MADQPPAGRHRLPPARLPAPPTAELGAALHALLGEAEKRLELLARHGRLRPEELELLPVLAARVVAMAAVARWMEGQLGN